MWMWHDVYRDEDGQKASLDAQQRSPGDASPKATRMNAMRLCVAAEMPPIAQRLQHAPPISSTCHVLHTNHLVQSGSCWLWAAKRVLLPQDCDILYRPVNATHRAVSPEETEPGPDAPLLSPCRQSSIDTSHRSRRSLLTSEFSMTP